MRIRSDLPECALRDLLRSDTRPTRRAGRCWQASRRTKLRIWWQGGHCARSCAASRLWSRSVTSPHHTRRPLVTDRTPLGGRCRRCRAPTGSPTGCRPERAGRAWCVDRHSGHTNPYPPPSRTPQATGRGPSSGGPIDRENAGVAGTAVFPRAGSPRCRGSLRCVNPATPAIDTFPRCRNRGLPARAAFQQ